MTAPAARPGASLSPSLATAVVAAASALCAVACGGGGGGGAAAMTAAGSTAASATATATAVPAAAAPVAPGLVAATFVDADASGGATAGDLLLLRFDAPVRVQATDPAPQLALAPGDALGAGATFDTGPAPEVAAVRLGAGAVLSLYGTYLPGRAAGPGATPARVALSAGRAPDAFVGAGAAPARDGPPVPVVDEDPAAAPVEQGRPFTAPALTRARVVYGSLHAHTGYSDGQLDPWAAHGYAKTTGGLDFMATTDHLEQVTQAHWDATQRFAAGASVPDRYAALVGFEWGHGYQPPLGWYNHVNIVGTTRLLGLGATMSLPGLYREAVARCLPEGAIGIFNHPYINKPPLVYNQWDDFAYDGAADKLMALIDCEAPGSRQTPQLGYLPALARGWHVAPGCNQDNHQPDWGTRNERRTGVWLEALDGPAVLQAVREGRAFSTSDRNARVRLLANRALWMGSTVGTPGPVALRVEAGDADGEGVATIELWSNGAVLHTQAMGGAVDAVLETTVDPTGDAYVFARVYQADGDELFSAPIYIDR